MSTAANSILKHKAINGWPLFWLIVLPMNVFMVVAITGFDLSKPGDVSHMISYSVRWAVPFIYFVLAASAMPVLFPGAVSQWWMRSRKYIGLVFAVAMAWQGAFIFIMSAIYTDYYYQDVYALRDESEGSSGYLFLAAMVFTSFSFGRRLISSVQWKLLHKSGTYFLWAYPFSVYWWNLYYYENPEPIDYVFYWAGFLAFAVRIAAWGKKRNQQSVKLDPGSETPLLFRGMGALLVAAGLLASATGGVWQETATNFLTAAQWAAKLEIWFPFWPFEPFLPLLIMALGGLLFTYSGSMDTARAVKPAGTV
ncbi:MAG: hypothetical protein AB8B57_10810 [Congregibacter sp.]